MVIRFPIRDGRGRITHIGGFDVDISSGKAMEQGLLELSDGGSFGGRGDVTCSLAQTVAGRFCGCELVRVGCRPRNSPGRTSHRRAFGLPRAPEQDANSRGATRLQTLVQDYR